MGEGRLDAILLSAEGCGGRMDMGYGTGIWGRGDWAEPCCSECGGVVKKVPGGRV